MNNQHLLFEYSPAFILLCIALGLGYAWLLYRAKPVWGTVANRFLFALRAIVVSIASFLLIGPVLKLTHNIVEKPALVFLVDNSLSVKETTDSLTRQKIGLEISRLKNSLENDGFAVGVRDLSAEGVYKGSFNYP